MLAEFIMDIYANMDTKEITILYDMEFGEELMFIEYDPENKEIDFVFAATGSVPFGMPLKQELSDYFDHAEQVTLLQMDMKKNKAVSGVVVTLKRKDG